LSDYPVLVCPPGFLDRVAAAVDADARAIVRTIWPHLLEASLAGLTPFTLEPAEPADTVDG
jgi:hypothetical protein